MGYSDLEEIPEPNSPAIDLQPRKTQALRAQNTVSQSPMPRRYTVPSSLYCPVPMAAVLNTRKGPMFHRQKPVCPSLSHKENENILTLPAPPQTSAEDL